MKGLKRVSGPPSNDGWDDSTPLVPLSEQLNAMFAPQVSQDQDGELLGFEGSFALPKGKMIDDDKIEGLVNEEKFFFFFSFFFFSRSCSFGKEGQASNRPRDRVQI